jgi:hypothetical protein
VPVLAPVPVPAPVPAAVPIVSVFDPSTVSGPSVTPGPSVRLSLAVPWTMTVAGSVAALSMSSEPLTVKVPVNGCVRAPSRCTVVAVVVRLLVPVPLINAPSEMAVVVGSPIVSAPLPSAIVPVPSCQSTDRSRHYPAR